MKYIETGIQECHNGNARFIVRYLECTNPGATVRELADALDDTDVLSLHDNWQQKDVEDAYDFLTSFDDESQAEAFARYHTNCLENNWDKKALTEGFKRAIKREAVDFTPATYEFRDGSTLIVNDNSVRFSNGAA